MVSAAGSLLLILFLADAASGLICFSCNSEIDEACKWGGLFSIGYDRKECFSHIGCYKVIVQKKNGEEFVERGCTEQAVGGCNTLPIVKNFFSNPLSDDPYSISKIACRTCDTDNCNSANNLGRFTLIGIMLSLIVGLVL